MKLINWAGIEDSPIEDGELNKNESYCSFGNAAQILK